MIQARHHHDDSHMSVQVSEHYLHLFIIRRLN
jgi:hypothetical protein